MIEYERKALQGVPDYRAAELLPKRSEYCLLIPVINEGARILTELGRAQTAGVDTLCDIVICDGGSTDGSMKLDTRTRTCAARPTTPSWPRIRKLKSR